MAQKQTYFSKNKHLIESTSLPFLKRESINPTKLQAYQQGQTIFLNKPLHWTSFDVIKKIRSTLGIKKVGHAGTLDPLATGVLIVCTGAHTKRITELMGHTKTYIAEITLGAVTESFDLETEPYNQKDVSHITAQHIDEVVQNFMGTVTQIPPKYSAIKLNGKSLYELARQGIETEIKPRDIIIYELAIISFELPKLTLQIKCSSGTYIRSLAHDIGVSLGTGAYLSALQRTAIGEVLLEQTVSLERWLQQLVEENANS